MSLRTDGIRVRRGVLSATHLADADGGPPRVAFAITKRVGGAVVRNRLRRRLRATCAALQQSAATSLPPGALLISAGPDAVHRTPDELKNDVVRLLDALATRRLALQGQP